MNRIVAIILLVLLFMAGVHYGENNRNADLNHDQKFDHNDFMEIVRPPENRRE